MNGPLSDRIQKGLPTYKAETAYGEGQQSASVAVCLTPSRARLRVGVVINGRESSVVLDQEEALKFGEQVVALAKVIAGRG